MPLSENGRAFLFRLENNKRFVYNDKTGKPISSYHLSSGAPTIGMGIKIDTQEERDLYRPYLNGKEASEDFIAGQNEQIIVEFEQNLDKKLAGAVFTQSMYDALFLLMWNTGMYSPTVKQAIKSVQARDYEGARLIIANGPIKDSGVVKAALVERRQLEQQLFASEPYPVTEQPPELIAVPSPTFWTPYTVISIAYLAFSVTVLYFAVRRIRQPFGTAGT